MSSRTILVGYALRDAVGRTREVLPHALVDQLQAIEPDCEVVYAPVPYDAALQARMRTLPRKSLEAEIGSFSAKYIEALARTEILFSLFAPVDLLARAPRLRWLANAGSGTEQYQAHGLVASKVLLTSAKGVAATSVAQFAMSQLLVLTRRWPQRIEAQAMRRWTTQGAADLTGRALGIVGLGEIGLEVARLAQAFGMRVLATRRDASVCPPVVDEVLPADRLHDMLGRCDAVVIATAYTSQTAGLFDAQAFASMREGAVLINVSRGGVVDERALEACLRSRRLVGAAFDVFAQEPLPEESPLWNVPGLLVSAHEAVGIPDYGEASFSRFAENFGRYLRGEPLKGVVDPVKGY